MFYRKNYESLATMALSNTAGSLMNLFHDSSWIITVIPDFSELIKPLHDLLEVLYYL